MACERKRHFYCPDCDTYHWWMPVENPPQGKTLMQVFAEEADDVQ